MFHTSFHTIQYLLIFWLAICSALLISFEIGCKHKICKHKHLNIQTLIIDTGMPLVACAGCWLLLTVCKSKICWQKCKALPYILVGIG